jgi:hypothetical protein
MHCTLNSSYIQKRREQSSHYATYVMDKIERPRKYTIFKLGHTTR